MKLNFELLSPLARKPTRATYYSAAYDLYTPEAYTIPPREQALLPLGIKWAPELWSLRYKNPATPDSGPIVVGGFFAKIFDKSGLALKQRFNTRAGVIDMDYPDPWNLICVNESDTATIHFDRGDKVAQFVLLPFLVADDLETIDQVREGGFGSTGK